MYSLIKQFFNNHGHELEEVRKLVCEVSELLDAISPFIQNHTEKVCPSCTDVCCTNKRSYYEYDDLIYICALNKELPAYKEGIPDSAPCQFLNETGCSVKRSIRPYRCTWYFCTPLLNEIISIPAAEYRRFIASLEEITVKREDFLERFMKINRMK